MVVGHSLGGVLAREYLRQRDPSQMKALITVGSPHFGAPVAQTVQNGEVGAMLGKWVEDLAAGPATTFGDLVAGRDYARYIISRLGYISINAGFSFNTFLQQRYGSNPAVDDLKPSSSFMNTLNSSPNNTLPLFRFAIFGAEKGPEYVRIAESASKERTSFASYRRAATVVYFKVTAIYATISGYYWYKYANSSPYSDPNYYTYYNRALFFLDIANQWFRGFKSLAYQQQKDWDSKVIGVNYYYTSSICGSAGICKDANDGLLPAITQAPPFFGSINDNRLRAIGANHLEQTAHPSVFNRIAEVFRKSEVDIPESTGGGGGPNPGPGPEPCPDPEDLPPGVVCEQPEHEQ